MIRPDPITWFAGGYTSGNDWWVGVILYGLLTVLLALALWLGWRVFRSGPRPLRDTALTWLMLACSALCVGVAFPNNLFMLLPALIAAALAAGCSVRVRKGGGSLALGVVVVSGWVVWLPACGVLAIALR